MSRGVCMTRAPVVRVRGGWGGTHLRYLAVKSAVRYWPITILPLDSSLTLMEWVEEVFKSLSIGGWEIWEGVPPPQLLLVCYEQLPTTIQGEGAAQTLTLHPLSPDRTPSVRKCSPSRRDRIIAIRYDNRQTSAASIILLRRAGRRTLSRARGTIPAGAPAYPSPHPSARRFRGRSAPRNSAPDFRLHNGRCRNQRVAACQSRGVG